MNVHSKSTSFLLVFSFFTCLQSADSMSQQTAAACKIQSAMRMLHAILHFQDKCGLTEEQVERLAEIRSSIRYKVELAGLAAQLDQLGGGGLSSGSSSAGTGDGASTDEEEYFAEERPAPVSAVAGADGDDQLLSDAASLVASVVSSHGSAAASVLQNNSGDLMEIVGDLFSSVRGGCRCCYRLCSHCEILPCKDDLYRCCDNYNPCWPLCECCGSMVDCAGEATGCVLACAAATTAFVCCGCYKVTKKTYKCCENTVCPWCYKTCCDKNKDRQYGVTTSPAAVVPAQVAMGCEPEKQAWQGGGGAPDA